MPTVYYQTTSGLTTLVLRTISAPGDTPDDANFVEDGDLPGLYAADASAAAAGQIASVELSNNPYDGGVIIEDDDGLLWFVIRTPSSGAAVDVDAIADAVADELDLRHGTGPWGGSGSGSGGSANPARGWAERSGHTEIVDVQFQPDDVAGAVQTIRVEHAIKREVDSNTQQYSGIALQADDCVWNIPTAELGGLTVSTGTKVIQLDGTVWTVVGFGESVTGVFGEETRPIGRREV